MLTVKQIAAIIADATFTKHDDDGVVHGTLEAAQKIHDLCKPAHDIHASAAMLENELTDTLVSMVIATVLGSLIDQEGGGRTNLSFSADLMAQTLKAWTYTVTHEGLVRTVNIAPVRADEWEASENNDALDLRLAQATGTHYRVEDLAPQAEPHEYNRPLWTVRYFDESPSNSALIMRGHDRADAERLLRSLKAGIIGHIENRWCLHPECPASGCNYDASKRDEVASKES